MIPSLLQIPSAVSDSKLHSVLPNNGKGDFTFDRSTGATRINKDGLIEEVGYFSSELVQNGNFSELGSELVTNGDFATNSDWSDVNNVSSIINGQLVFNNNSFGGKFQNTSMVVGKTYKLVYTIVSISNGYIQPRLGDTGLATQRTSAGTYTEYVVCAVDSIFRLYGASSDAIVDNVSVKQVDPNDRWTLGTGWSYGDGKAKASGVSGSNNLTQSSILTVGKSYKITITVSEYVSGSVEVSAGASPRGSMNANGTYTFIQTATPNTSFYIISQVFNGAVDNVSVVEVQGNRPRLSYDITNGVVEKQPHLLLEPSATNLLTFSADFSQWSNNNLSTLVSTSEKSPLNTYATLLKENAVNQYHNINLGIADTNGATFSVLAKKINRDYLLFITGSNTGVGAWFDLSDGTTTQVTGSWNNPKIQDMGNGWYLCSANYSTNTGTRFYLGSSDSLSNLQYQGINNLEALYFGFAQVEATAYATSYIPTAGTTITRAAETCNNSKPSVNSTEGVLYCEIAALADDGTFRMLSVSDGTTNNRVRINYSATSQQLQARLVTGGVTQADLVKYSTDVINFQKAAIQYKANEVKLYVDGSLASSDTLASVPSAGTLNVINFNGGDGTFPFYGKVKGLAVYNEALTDAQLIELTN